MKFTTNAFETVKVAIDESHRSSMLFDYLDDSFFRWISLNEKNGQALNYYKDQRDLLEWSFVSLVYAYGYYYQIPSESIDLWVYSDPEKYAVKYYLDNFILRIYAILERVYKFCDMWFELGLAEKSGRLYHTENLFDINKMKEASKNIAWTKSNLFSELTELRESYNYKAIKLIRNDLTHNLDQRNSAIKYNKSNETIEALGPDISIGMSSLDQAKSVLKCLYRVRALEANVLSEDLDNNNVRRILPSDQDYWIDSDSPLF
jgi:hypothetical protein